jgi:LysR family hydrogen peroxide-inducible transcriptional activator
VRLGVIPTVAPYVLPRIVARLSARYPGLDLHLRETVTSRLIGELAEGSLDAAILALPVGETAFEEVPLFSETFVLVRPGATGRPVPSPERLREMRLLLLEEGHCFRDQALSFCNMTSSAPREMMDGSSLSTLVQMVGAGLGVTLIPEMAVDIETRSADVSVDGFDAPGPERTIGMIWRRSNPLSEQLRELSGIVREAATGAA